MNVLVLSDATILDVLMRTLPNVGVNDENDMQHLKEDDIQNLNKIQTRKLLAAFKGEHANITY